MKKYSKVGSTDTLEVGRIFMDENRMNDFYFFDTLEDAVAYSENCVKEYNRRSSEKTVNGILKDLGQPFLNRIGWTEKDTGDLTELVETL